MAPFVQPKASGLPTSSPEGDSASLIAALLAGSEAELAAELEPAVEAFIGNAVFRYVAEEALVAIAVTAVFFVLAAIAPYLPSITWALAAAGAVLVHFARGLVSTWPLVRALVLLRGAPVFRFALFVLARHALTLLEAKMQEIGRAASLIPRFGLRLARVVYQDDRDRVALALADALGKSVRRELLWTAALGLLPMLVVMFGFRSALMWKAGLYGVAHMAWWELLMLPFRGGMGGP
jgi:hypothetical protein